MFDPGPKREPLTTDEKWISAIFLAVFVGLFVAEIVHDYHPGKLSALLFVLLWIPLLALHEAGHALAAALVGWHVGQVVIGVGRLLASFRWGGAVVELRVFPVEGFVKCVPTNLRSPQIKSAFIYFAGPGIELLLAVLVLLIVGPEQMFTRTDDYLMIAWQCLALTATVQAVLNLIPTSVWTPQGDIANDGLGIIRSFYQPDSHYAQMIDQTYNEREEEWEQDD